ncbi:MAG: hypothetical protein HRT58_12225 [Crocinitomicaceae bacterium]|nr:hypothetical protein [Flavobacteriales bacterium]NQZ36428.1 hypothetical protein [Crocinitomicaceae bacterium]
MSSIIQGIGEQENCNFLPTLTTDNDSSFLSVKVDCDVPFDFIYGKYLIDIFQALSEEKISFDKITILNQNDEIRATSRQSRMKSLLDKKHTFLEHVQLLREGEFEKFAGQLEYNQVALEDSVAAKIFRGLFKLKGEITFRGYILNEYVETGDTKEKYITLFCGDGSDNLMSLTLGAEATDSRIYSFQM